MSGDPTPRLLAAAAALTGTVALMVRSEPSWTGLLIGLSCLGLWGLGTLASQFDRPLPLTRPARPRMPQAVIVETPRAPLELLLAGPRADRSTPSDRQAIPIRPPHILDPMPEHRPQLTTHRQQGVGRRIAGRR